MEKETIVDFPRTEYCVTNPPLKMEIDYTPTGKVFRMIPNLDAICGCGKPYYMHDQWKQK